MASQTFRFDEAIDYYSILYVPKKILILTGRIIISRGITISNWSWVQQLIYANYANYARRDMSGR